MERYFSGQSSAPLASTYRAEIEGNAVRARGRYPLPLAFGTLAIASAVYLVLFLVGRTLLDAGVPDTTALASVHVAGAASLLTLWKLIPWGVARYNCFGAALLLVMTVFRLHAALDALVYGLRESTIPVTVPISGPLIELFMRAETISHFGMLLVAWSWRLCVGDDVERFSFVREARAVSTKMAGAVYGSALALNAAERVAGASFGAFEQIAFLTFVFGVVSVYFIAIQRPTALGRVAFALGLAMPMVGLALGSGMKEEMFFPLIPAAMIYWSSYRGFWVRAAAVVVGFAALSLSQLYVGYVRDTTWKASGALQMSTTELLEGFATEFVTLELGEGFDKISSRINQTTTHAVTVTLADHDGHEPFEIFGLIPASLVPRLFWPDKPILQPGALHTARIYRHYVPISKIRTATAAGFVTELYLGASYFGVVFGTIFYGILLGLAQRWTLSVARGFAHYAFCFITLYWTLRFDEKHVVYTYTSVIFTVIFVWMMKRTVEFFGLRT